MKELLALALPAAASALLNNTFRVIDQYAAGSLGTAAQGAIGSSAFVLIGLFGLQMCVGGGVGPLVGRATGAGDMALRARAFGNAVTGSVIVAIVLALLLWPATPLLVGMLGLTGETAANAVVFLRWIAAGGALIGLLPVLDAALVATGRTGLMFGLQATAALLNFVLNPLFIHTLGLGVAGAALATVVGRGVPALIGLMLVGQLFRPRLQDFVPDATLLRMLRIGSAVSVNILAYALVYWALLRVVISPLGLNAATGIGFSALEGITYPIFLGLSLGVSSLVSRRLGAGQPEAAAQVARVAFPLASGLGVTAGLVFWFGARPLCGIFTHDPVVLEQAIIYARVLAFSQLAVSWEALAEGVLLGAGDSKTVFRWSAPLNTLRVPLGWFLAMVLGFGAPGLWWAINLTSYAKALGKGWSAWSGAWKVVRV